ncbi:6346_t:CDS:2 [Diversispora eburnea]|uniref:6346_t:CDS:1 n=1 Tax=Diversispora eburnea TaxID=1213867 RepID=A0A9N9FNC9_9GLOM|nr:6346_t:CDS:2 [Diversispora eburnea]
MVQTFNVPSFDKFDEIIDKVTKENIGRNIYVLLFDISTGKSWCPDCIVADPLIRNHISKEIRGKNVIVEVPVGTRSETHSRIQLKAIPTLIKWSFVGIHEDKRLVENDCTNDYLLNKFFLE